MPSTHRTLCEDEKADVKECLFGQKRVGNILKFIHIEFIFLSSNRFFVNNTCINIGNSLFFSILFEKLHFSFHCFLV